MNTHESYVSLETAKLLKQAGFDWETIKVYGQDEGLYGTIGISRNFNAEKGFIAAPSLAVAQRWLREVRGWEAQVAYGFDENGHKTYVTECGNPKGDLENYIVYFSTYEEALEACIRKCLTLLLQK